MATDQEIRDAGLKYVPKQKYLQNPYELPVEETPPAEDGGITNTNAFTNSGGNNFNPAGNAFGYGSPVSEVNVRTFNPQSNDPTGSVANAQTMYNKASNAGPIVETFSGMRPSQEVMDYYGEQIMNNKEQYGAQGQYNSPYEDSIDLGYQGTLGNKGMLNRFKNKIGDAAKFVGGLLPFPLNVATKFLPQGDDNGPGGGTYGIAGLSDDKKAAYNALAKDGYLFGGEQGFKTLTGKNFQATNYVPNQLEMYNKIQKKQGKSFAKMTEDEIAALTGFQKKQYLESSAMYKATQKQKQKQKEEFDKPGGTGEQVAALNKKMEDTGVTGDNYNQAANERGGGGGNTATNSQGQTAREATYDGNKNTGTSQGYSQHYADGGRAGYFFGGRVNYKVGGRTDAESQYGADSVGSYDSSQNKSGRQQSYGGDNNDGASDNPPVTVVNNPVDFSTVTKSLGNYNIPVGLEALMADKGKLQAVLNADNILDKNLGAEFTYDKGPYQVGFNADMEGNKNLGVSYNKGNLSAYANTDFDNPSLGFKYSRAFANGGLAGLL